MTKKFLGIGFALVALVIVVAMKRTDDKVPVPAAPKNITRVVSLSPSMTETMIALGLAHFLVGVTVQCKQSEVKHASKIGSFAEPSFEAIINLKPDLVLGVPHVMAKNLLDRISSLGIEVFAHQPDSLSDIKFVVASLARKFNSVEHGRQVNAHIDRSLLLARNALSLSIAKKSRLSALIVVANSPFVVAGRTTFASQIVEAMGLTNLASSKTAWPVWPLEKLIAEPPAFMILAYGSEFLPGFHATISSLGIDIARNNINLIVPAMPIFQSPSPAIIKDVEYLTDLFLVEN